METIGEKGALRQEVPQRLHAQICYRFSLPLPVSLSIPLSLFLLSIIYLLFFLNFIFCRALSLTHKDIAIRYVWEVARVRYEVQRGS